MTVVLCMAWLLGPDPTGGHLALCFSLMLAQWQALGHMRLRAVLAMGALVACVLTPVMRHLWLGAHLVGNANFLYFQNLNAGVFGVLAVLEVAGAFLRKQRAEREVAREDVGHR
jgi:hypothetical protein